MYGLVILTKSIDRSSTISQRETSTRSIRHLTVSLNGISTRSIELVGVDSSKGSIIIWQTGNVNWRRI